MSAFLNARGALPLLKLHRTAVALAEAGRAALRPQALLALLILVFLPSNAYAEYTRVELTIFGMDCAICAHGIRVAVHKVDGVESVELSLDKAQADIRLRPGNHVSLDQFRTIVKANGFDPRQATVTAVGTARASDGKLAFEVSGVPTPLLVVTDQSAASAHQQLKSALDSTKPVTFEIVGTVDNKGDGIERIRVSSVTRK
jgi:copper chaperone CopZ